MTAHLVLLVLVLTGMLRRRWERCSSTTLLTGALQVLAFNWRPTVRGRTAEQGAERPADRYALSSARYRIEEGVVDIADFPASSSGQRQSGSGPVVRSFKNRMGSIVQVKEVNPVKSSVSGISGQIRNQRWMVTTPVDYRSLQR
jgi:hypothetical protein